MPDRFSMSDTSRSATPSQPVDLKKEKDIDSKNNPKLVDFVLPDEIFPLADKSELKNRTEKVNQLKENSSQTLAENDDIDDGFENISDWLAALEAQYGTVAANTLQSNGSHGLTLVQHNYPMHFAALEGNVELLEKLLREGYSIDSKDNLDSTPLHVATMANQAEVVQFLIDNGANVNAMSYDVWDAASLAIVKGHYEIAQQLLNQPNIYVDEFTSNVMLDALYEASQDGKITTVNEVLSLMKALAQHITPATITVSDMGIGEQVPIASLLQIIAAHAPKMDIRDMLLNAADYVNSIDKTEQHYLDAKLLMHVLPVAGLYEIAYSQDENNKNIYNGVISAEGHFSNYTVHAADYALSQYIESLASQPNHFKLNLFTELESIVHRSAMTAQAKNDTEVADSLLDAFFAGEKVLLPTGWTRHFVTTILDGKNNYLVICNTGQKFQGNEDGSTVYKIHHPEKLDQDILHTILMNEEQFDLEYDLQYKLGLEKIMVLPEPHQTTGNCGWRSVEVGVEALAFLKLLDEGFTINQAKFLAHDWYSEWYQFTATETLSHYLENDPRLEVSAYVDILTDNHPSLFDSELPIDENEWQRAEMILKTLSSDLYKDEFLEISDALEDVRPELADLMSSYGLVASETQVAELSKTISDLQIEPNSNIKHIDSENNKLTLDEVLENKSNLIFQNEVSIQTGIVNMSEFVGLPTAPLSGEDAVLDNVVYDI